MIPEIEHCDLGGGYVEGYFYIDDIAAYLALQTGIPYETIRARIIEAHGYCKRPPKNGEKILFIPTLTKIDDFAIRAMQQVIDDFVLPSEIEDIKRSYLASEFGDAWWIAWDLQLHPYIVLAVLRNLAEKGELPED